MMRLIPGGMLGAHNSMCDSQTVECSVHSTHAHTNATSDGHDPWHKKTYNYIILILMTTIVRPMPMHNEPPRYQVRVALCCTQQHYRDGL